MRRRRRNLLISGVSQALSMLILRGRIPSQLIAFSSMNVTAHEHGHYLTASARGGNADYPIVVSMGFFAFGVTTLNEVSTLGSEDIQDSLSAGFKGGMMMLLACSPLALLSLLPLSYLLYGALYETLSMTVGSDGSKYRRYRRLGRRKALNVSYIGQRS